ncbi:MAG: multidrug effflux MFS transporter [Rhodospirillales bacterium]|nr:multidrug effflux MFS transporter [Rhodospirillales bacterium]
MTLAQSVRDASAVSLIAWSLYTLTYGETEAPLITTASNRTNRTKPKPHPESLVVGALLTALVALGQISTSIYIPSLPSLVNALATDQARVGLTLSLFLLGFAVCQLIYGPLSDRFGRRPVLLAGITLYLGSCIACALAPTIDALIVCRFVQGMSACSGPVLGRAIIRDIYGPMRAVKALAYVGMALAISPAVAPIIGGYLQDWFGWRAAFVFLAVVGFVLLAAIFSLLDETSPNRDASALDPKALMAAYRVLLTSRTFHGYTLSVAFVFAGLMAYTAGAPFVFIEVIGLTPAQFGTLAIFSVVGFFFGSLAAGRLSARFGLDRLLLIGLALCVAGGVSMLVVGVAGYVVVAAIIAPMMVFTSGMGIVLASGIAGAMAPFSTIAGAASAVLGFIQMTVAAVASTVVGSLAQTSQLPMASVIAATAIAGLAAFVTLVWRPRQISPTVGIRTPWSRRADTRPYDR